MPDQGAASSEHDLIREVTEPLSRLPHDALTPVADVDFPIVLRGYDRIAVDAYVRQTAQLVAELQATRSPEAAVRRALERVGEEVSGILQRAHETADEITSASRREAEERLETSRHEAEQRLESSHSEAEQRLESSRRDAEQRLEEARLQAVQIAADAERRLRELDAETDRIWAERHQIVEDARLLANQLVSLADAAAERFPADEPALEGGDSGERVGQGSVLASEPVAALEQAAADPEPTDSQPAEDHQKTELMPPLDAELP